MRSTYECVRGITFQPVQDAGRNLGFDKNRDRVLLTDIRRDIAETSRRLRRGRRHPAALQSRCDRHRLWPARRQERHADHPADPGGRAARPCRTRSRSRSYPELKRPAVRSSVAVLRPGERTKTELGDLLCCLPQVEVPARSRLRQGLPRRDRAVPRPLQFLHRPGQALLHPFRDAGAARSFPFDTYNLFYRNGQPVRRRAAYV